MSNAEWTELHLELGEMINLQGIDVDCSDDEYIQRYHIEQLLQNLRQKLLETRPKNPVKLLGQYLDHLGLKQNHSMDIFAYWTPHETTTHDKGHNLEDSYKKLRQLSKVR